MNDMSLAANFVVILFSAMAALPVVWGIRRVKPSATMKTLHRDVPLIPLVLALWLVSSIVMFYFGVTISPVISRMPGWIVAYIMPLAWLMLYGLFAFAFTFAAVFTLLEGDRQWRPLAISAVLLLLAIQLVQWNVCKPVSGRLYDDITRDGVVLQTSGVSCMAATGANIARDLGIDATEPLMAERMGTSIIGTSVSQFIRGMGTVGIECTPVFIGDLDPSRLSPPAELRVLHKGDPHAVMFAGMINGTVEVLDPIKVRVYYSPDELGRIWTGGALECRLGSSGA